MSFWPTCKTTAAVVITTLVLLVAAYNLFDYWPSFEFAHPNPPVAKMRLQQRASHMLAYLDESGKEKGVCTGTAIGPHAVLTAAHCNSAAHGTPSTSLHIDYSEHVFNIIAVTGDDRDHEIYLLDGPAFTYVIPYATAPATPGQHVQYFGFGDAVYPSTIRQGHVRPNDDPSDVDSDSEFHTFDFPAVHGDSGSAIYDDQGRIIGIVTYVLPWYGRDCMGAFALNFSPEKIRTAQTFDPAKFSLLE